jgi:hypothetical protein
MLKTKSFDIKPVPGITTIPYKRYDTKEQLPDASAQPPTRPNLVDKIRIECNADISEGDSYIIDVLTDFRYPLLYLIYYAVKHYIHLDQKKYPTVTIPSILAYTLVLFHAHFLACDIYRRPKQSDHANNFQAESYRREYFTTLLNCHVPDFVIELIDRFMPATDPRRPGISFIPSFAGFSPAHDLIYSFPPIMFLAAHSIFSKSPSNVNPLEIYAQWLKWPVITGGITRHTGNFLGAYYHNNDTYESWLYNAVYSAISPATLRAVTARDILSNIPVVSYDTPPGIPLDDLDPYILLLGADEDNLPIMDKFMKTMSSIIAEKFPNTRELGSLYNNVSSLDILLHGYTNPTLPTGHEESIPTNGSYPHPVLKTPREYATARGFLGTRTWTRTSDLLYPADASVINSYLYLVHSGNHDHTINPGPDKWIQFDKYDHINPKVRVFDPYEGNVSTAHIPLITGRITTTYEIDGFTVPQPDPNLVLRDENSYLLQSAVPVKKIKPISDLHNMKAIGRQRFDPDSQKVGMSLIDFTRNRLPRFDQTVGDGPRTSLFGFDVATHMPWFDTAFTYLGFQTGSSRSTMPTKRPLISDGRIIAWSPYRFVADPLPSDKQTGIYMLLNFRTIYGTNVTLIEVDHPSKAIPRT